MSFLSQPITIQSLLGLSKNRTFGNITVQVVINEAANDTLTITKQPVQTGASITDHAYLEPTTFSMTIRFQDNLSTSLSKIYQSLIQLQQDREPFDIVTPKRVYNDMLLASIRQTTDKSTENVLAIDCSFQQVLLVDIQTTTVPRSRQKNPGKTGATKPAGKKQSALGIGGRAISPNVPLYSK